MPDLEARIKEGKLQGSWPAARDDWGIYASKLETVLLVAVPSEEHQRTDRVLPERGHVYIVPQSSCIEGKLLRCSDTARYYSNCHIKACFVLRPSDVGGLAPTTGRLVRVACTSEFHARPGGCVMTNVCMRALADDERASDELDSSVFPPRVLRCAAIRADLFLTTFRRMPTANAEGLERIGGYRRKGLGETRL